MAIRKLPETFDQHLGSVIDGLAKARGGRPWLASLTDWSEGTVERRVTGRTEFTVKELEIVAAALGSSPATIVSHALRNYANSTEQDGVAKLLREEGPMSAAPVSLTEHRTRKKPSEMTEDELDAFKGEQAANTDPELGRDEPEAP
ncbi:hypothetical protein [Microbacterium sp. LWH11-1.2]|uniref:hypothetical protein n=1 Tax=Microbacterium sp. LWH11-1.2 TaxID=3135258 RepID=UPI0031387E16